MFVVRITTVLCLLHQAVALKHTCCEALSKSGSIHVLYPDDKLYKDRISSYWSVSAQLSPHCLVMPKDTSEVSKTIITLTEDAACSQTTFALRSGGHMTWSGSNNIQDGITIDLGLMNNTQLDQDARIASIQPGSRFGQVYETLDPLGFTIAGGRAASVGVGGFLLGGGNSFFSAQHGFACDTVQNFEVVLANGDIVNANAKENSDLFQALKGGGPNFGIVTRFDMQAFEAVNLWGGTMMYPKTTSQQHILAYADWTKNLNKYPQGSAIIFWSYLPTVEDVVILAAYEDTTGTENPPAFGRIMEINATMSTMRIDSHRALTEELEQPAGYYDIWFTLTIANDVRIYQKIVELHEAMVTEWLIASNNDKDFITMCMFQSIPMIFAQHGMAKGGNVLGLDGLEEDVVMLLFNIAVKSSDLEVRARKMVKSYRKQMMRYASSLNGLVDWRYLNYADYDQDPIRSYGAANVAKIRRVAEQYDPHGIFQKKIRGGFKISEVGLSEEGHDVGEMDEPAEWFGEL